MLENFSLPAYVLSFDPGGSGKTWAYTLSTLKFRSNRILYCPLECGFLDTLENIAKPDFSKHNQFKSNIEKKYAGAKINLVAERFIGRGFTSWLSEYIAFELGYWSAAWKMGECRFIMAAQWKRKIDKEFKTYTISKKYEKWWESFWSDYTSIENQKDGVVHIQDSCGIGYWYWSQELNINCIPEGMHGH